VASDTQRVEVRAVDSATGEPKVYATFRAIGTPAAGARVLFPTPATPYLAPAGEAVDSVAARVVDAYGNAVAGATVSWSTAPGNGSVPPTSVTGADGLAHVRWTLAGRIAPQTLRAQLDTSSATLALNAVVPLDVQIIAVSATPDTVTTDVVPTSVVGVRTPGGVALEGVAMTFTTRNYDGRSLGTSTAPTDATGRASAAWMLDTQAAGPFTLTAAVAALPARQVVFAVTRRSTGPMTFLFLTGGSVTLRPQPTEVSFVLLATSGAPVPGVPVTLTVSSSSGYHAGSVSPTQLTSANGVNTVVWTPEFYNQITTLTASAPGANLGKLQEAWTTYFSIASTPASGSTVGDSVHLTIEVRNQGNYDPASASAMVGGRSFTLAPAGFAIDTWTYAGDLDLAGLPAGATEVDIVVQSTQPTQRGASYLILNHVP
jgi:hypothetical protein